MRQAGADLQDFAYSASQDDDARVEKIFSDAGVDVTTMDDAAFDEWQTLAQKQWDAFAKSAPHGQELMDLAKKASGPVITRTGGPRPHGRPPVRAPFSREPYHP